MSESPNVNLTQATVDEMLRHMYSRERAPVHWMLLRPDQMEKLHPLIKSAMRSAFQAELITMLTRRADLMRAWDAQH